MRTIYSLFVLLAWSIPSDAESEEKRTTVTSHAVTTNPISLSNNNDPNGWNNPRDWQKGWHDGWHLEYDANRAEWRGQPYSSYGQLSTDHRTYGNSASNEHPHKSFNHQGNSPEYGYSNLYGYGYNRHSYAPYNSRYGQYGGVGNYGGYGYYGQRHGQGLYDHINRRGGYRPKSNYGQPYYGYDKGWSNGR